MSSGNGTNQHQRDNYVKTWRVWFQGGVWNCQLWSAVTGAVVRAPLLVFNSVRVQWVPDPNNAGQGWFRAENCEAKVGFENPRNFSPEQGADVDCIRLVPISQTVLVPTISTKIANKVGRARTAGKIIKGDTS